MLSSALLRIVTSATGLAEQCTHRVLDLAEPVLPGWLSGRLRTAGDAALALSRRAIWQMLGWLPRSMKNQIGLNLLLSDATREMGVGSTLESLQLQMMARAMKNRSPDTADGPPAEEG